MSLPEVRQLDIHISNRCNLSCLRCNRFAKIPEEQYPTDKLLADIAILGKHLRVRAIHIVGGEPTLHPDLHYIISAIRDQRMAWSVGLLTNGTNVKAFTPPILRMLDNVHLSVYPGATPPEAETILRARAREVGCNVSVARITQFAQLYDPTGSGAGVFDKCFMRDCKEYRAGVLNRCSTAYPISRFTGEYKDAIIVEDTPEFAAALVGFASSNEPLAACRFCRGSTRVEAWRQVPDMDEWLAANELPHR